MKKQILFTMLLAMFAVASWGQTDRLTTEMLEPSTNVENPENLYVLKNGWLRLMTPTSGPTEHIFNAGLFAFFAEDLADIQESGNAYKIYCVNSKKWISYTPAEPGLYQEQVNFAKLVDTREEAEPWSVVWTKGIRRPNDECYVLQPYYSNEAEKSTDDGRVYRRLKSDKYMNWYGSYNNYPNDILDMSVGLSFLGAAKEGGGMWTLRKVRGGNTVSDSFIEECNAAFVEWCSSIKFGDGWDKTEEYDTALAAFTTAFTAKDVVAMLTAAQQCFRSVYVIGDVEIQEGHYYRFKNTETQQYLGLWNGLKYVYDGNDGYDRVLVSIAGGDHNPSAVWKCEKIDDRYVLKNLYAGLYIQDVGAPNTATFVGINNSNAFTYVLETAATTDCAAKWKLYVGDRRLSDDGEYIVQGTGDNSFFNIERVEISEDVLKKQSIEWYRNNPKDPVQTANPIPVQMVDKAQYVITPYGLPNTNEAIIEVNMIVSNINIDLSDSEPLSIERIYRMYEAWDKSLVNPYQEYASRYTGDDKLISDEVILYTTKENEWATICVPTNWGSAIGLKRYTCEGMDKASLKLREDKEDTQTKESNTPYIIKIDSAYFNTTYQFVCFEKDLKNTTKPTNGWLVGVRETTKVPNSDTNYDRYVLAKSPTGKVGFYHVQTDKLTAQQYQCYLEIPKEENAARYSFLFFQEDGDVETGIDNILDTDVVQDDKQGNKQNGKIYNMAGQRLNRMQKGLNIVNGKIIIK